MQLNALADKLELWGFEEGFALFKDSSIGFGYKISPFDISCESDERINQIKQQLKNLLGGFPSEIDIQFVQSIEKSGKKDLEDHLLFANDSQEIIKKLSEARFEKFARLDEVGALPCQENLVLVRVPFQSKRDSLNSWIYDWLLGKKKDETRENFEQSMSRARVLRDEIERNLESSGLLPQRIEPSLLIEKAFDLWNPSHPIGISEFDESDVRSRLLVSDLVKEVRGFRLGAIYHRVVTLKILPEETFAGMSSALVNLPFSSRLYLSIHVPDQNKEIEWLKLNRRMAFAMVVGKKGVSDLETEAKLQDVEDILNEVVKNGEKIFSISLAIVLRSENEHELDAQVSHVLQVIRELSGAEGYMETYAAFDVFSASALPNVRNKERQKKVKSSNLADLLPVFGLWSGFEKPSVLLRNHAGGLFKFDSFSQTLTNANQIISGGSGSGKSYLTNLMIGQMLSQNPRVFVLDVGGSYEKTCDLLNGQYIPLSMDSGVCINPFDRSNLGTVTDDKIKFLLGLVQIMTKEDDQKAIGKLEKAEIERSIQEVYVEQERPRLSHLREKLLQSLIPEVQRIGKILALWCGESPFGKFLDRETNMSVEKRVVCFDFKGLEANPDLQAACLFTIMDMVWREVQRDRSEMKFLVFDECWRLLENEAGSQFVAEVFRTFRKYYASAIAISQNIDDFAKSKAASAIMPNSSIKWILKQPGADFERLASVLRLNEREIAQIQSLTQVKGQFSEAFLICEEKKAVVSVESTPFEYWQATTDPKDFALMKRVKESSGLVGLELIEKLANEFPNGAQKTA